MRSPLSRLPLDIGVVVALAWLMSAAVVTLIYGPILGLRGWIWLGVHHVLCGVGCTHELTRGWKRRRVRLNAARSALDPEDGSESPPLQTPTAPGDPRADSAETR